MLEDTQPVPHDPAQTVAAPYRWHEHRSVDHWTWACAVAIAAELRRELQRRPRARLLLSGGTTPAPVYRALARAPLDWARVDVALVDERWLQPGDPDSNAWLVRQHLLRDNAAAARFESLTRPGQRIEEAVAAANAHALQPAGAVVLGMGEDGHTASLFPDMLGLERALASRQAYVAVDAEGCPGARDWRRRISLTPRGLAQAQARFLLIQGESKRDAFLHALASGDVQRWPVLIGLQGPNPLDVHWSP
ncbi:6-phosphogluconolactonase [Lysobacter firmicutimachus]|uniref:6-phosphogluconolactonase n=1 Tax=Lysobacter firmicutimachus TaxID=1792846 RepID=A0AAU8MUA5_9GAMM|nr:6-phosphogluconolactonase [Lysobacter antibioticus]